LSEKKFCKVVENTHTKTIEEKKGNVKEKKEPPFENAYSRKEAA